MNSKTLDLLPIAVIVLVTALLIVLCGDHYGLWSIRGWTALGGLEKSKGGPSSLAARSSQKIQGQYEGHGTHKTNCDRESPTACLRLGFRPPMISRLILSSRHMPPVPSGPI